MTYLKTIIRKSNKYFKNKRKIKYKKIDVTVLKTSIQVIFKKILKLCLKNLAKKLH